MNLRKPKRISISAPSGVRLPQLLDDLYVDLRDRRLLPLIAVLLVAIVAAPILLAGKDEPEQPQQPAPAPSSAAPAQASFAVVPADPGLRAYRRRLGHRRAKNPFQQPQPKPAPSTESAGGETSAAGGSTVSEATGGESSGGEATAPSSGPSTQTTTDVVVQHKVIGYAIDARAGFVGHVKPRQSVPPTTKLPSAKNPVVVFMGLTKDKKRALFLMTSNVTAYYGKGHCALEKESCQLLELKPGKSATFAYGYGNARYKLTLLKIVPVVDTHEAAATVTTKGDSTKHPAANSGSATAGH
jgi:hypothetical protein